MKLSIGKKLTIGFAIVIACLITVSAVSYFTAEKFIEISKLKLQSREVLLALDAVSMRLANADAGESGYILAGDQSDLALYSEAVEKLNSRLNELRNQTKDNSIQQANMDKLEPLVAKKLEGLAGVVYLRKEKGFDEAMAGFKKDINENPSILNVINQMRSEELSLLKKRDLAAEAAKKVTETTSVFGTLLALILSAIVVLVINRSVTKPIMKLTEVADAISKGDTKIGELKVVSNDEIGKLTESFNRMSASIRLLLEEGKK